MASIFPGKQWRLRFGESPAFQLRLLVAPIHPWPDVEAKRKVGRIQVERYRKERIEVLRGGQAWVLDDFRSLSSYGSEGEKTTTDRSQDKGHAKLLSLVLKACRGEGRFEPGIGAAYVAQSVALASVDSIATGSGVDASIPSPKVLSQPRKILLQS